ncbi:phosphotransferase family protein [Desertihabitans brevis]|uniref:phosphotransferase n=1 Tax=Desertihabitans brevis TaxID=2268447 RepID=UPI001314B377|nr:phosphotransferase [Desertihabitans brevis]
MTRTSLTPGELKRPTALARRREPCVGLSAPVLIGAGTSTLTYALGSSGDGWALRVSRSYPEPWTWRGGRRHEVALIAEFRRRDVPFPADAAVLEDVDGLPTAILERRVVGTPLRPQDVTPGSPMVKVIATLLDRLHGVDVADAVALGVRRDDPTAEFRHAATTVDLDPDLRDRVLAMVDWLEGRAANRTSWSVQTAS